jgi:hypothetical protein
MRPQRLVWMVGLVVASFGGAGCKRDPNLSGIWDIALLTVGQPGSGGDAREWAGMLEMRTGGDPSVLISRYAWDGQSLVALESPGPVEVEVLDSNVLPESENLEDFKETYQEEGETYFLTWGPGFYSTAQIETRWKVLDYTGGTVRLLHEEGFVPQLGVAPSGWEAAAQTGEFVPPGAPTVELWLRR